MSSATTGGPRRDLIGPLSLLESWDRPAWWTPPGAPHRLEALIGTPGEPGHLRIEHWFAGQARPDNPWLRGDVVSTQALGPAALSQRGRAGTATHELLAHVPEPDGVVAYAWAVNDPTPRRWRRLGIVTQLPSEPDRPLWDGPEGPAEWGAGRVVATATAATRLRSGWVQALVQVDDSIYHLHRQQRGGKVRWLRHACLRLADPAPFAIASEPSMKVAQVSGETDSQPERPRRTLSSSESRSGVRGTDLGVRIDHAGQAFMLFGDTHWTRRRLGTRDSIAAVHQPDADLPSVTFHGSPTAITGGGTTLREYDVPLDAFSLDGELYAFFTSNHFRDAQVMGRSVLTRAPRPVIEPTARWRPLRFAYRGTFSTHRFVNVSVQRWGDHLYLWGTGAYRADDVRLARVDLTTPGLARSLRSGSGAVLREAVRYWVAPHTPVIPANAGISTPDPSVRPANAAISQPHERLLSAHGSDDQLWSPHESDARPLFTPGALGELSVRWVPDLGRFAMLTMSGPDDSIGAAVVLRTAERPWGPWSPRLRLFDWIEGGMSFADERRRFIKAHRDGSDPVGDAIFAGQATATGAAYAPYLFDARVQAGRLVLRYTLSTWNPYQVVLMRHHLAVDDLITTSYLV